MIFSKGNEVSQVLRYLFIIIIGFILTFLLSGDFFNENNMILNLFMRICFALFFALIIWLLQKTNKRSKT